MKNCRVCQYRLDDTRHNKALNTMYIVIYDCACKMYCYTIYQYLSGGPGETLLVIELNKFKKHMATLQLIITYLHQTSKER